MPDFTKPLSRIGATLGGAAGTGLGMLGSAIGLLDEPRKYLWNQIIGTDSGAEALGRLGLDTGNPIVQALGTGAEMVFDPMNLFGGLGGALAGSRLARRAAPALEAAALARGPRYAGGIEKLTGAGIPKFPTPMAHLEDLMDLPADQLKRILQEIPQGSEYFRHGKQGLVFKTPQGDLLRMAPALDEIDRMVRAPIPEMLQSTRGGLVGNMRLERAPMIDTARFDASLAETPNMRSLRTPTEARGFVPQEKGGIKDVINSRGYNPVDVHQNNLGTYRGQTVVLDPGAVIPRVEFGQTLPELADWSTQKPGRFKNWLLDRLGADQAVQREIEDMARLYANY